MAESYEYEERVWLMTKGLIEGLQREREELLVALRHVLEAGYIRERCSGCRAALDLLKRLDKPST